MSMSEKYARSNRNFIDLISLHKTSKSQAKIKDKLRVIMQPISATSIRNCFKLNQPGNLKKCGGTCICPLCAEAGIKTQGSFIY